MIQLVLPLILLNFGLLLAIGLIRQANPFEIWVLGLLAVGNAIMFGAAAIMTHDDWVSALSALVTNFVPVAFAVSGVALLLVVMSVKSRS